MKHVWSTRSLRLIGIRSDNLEGSNLRTCIVGRGRCRQDLFRVCTNTYTMAKDFQRFWWRLPPCSWIQMPALELDAVLAFRHTKLKDRPLSDGLEGYDDCIFDHKAGLTWHRTNVYKASHLMSRKLALSSLSHGTQYQRASLRAYILAFLIHLWSVFWIRKRWPWRWEMFDRRGCKYRPLGKGNIRERYSLAFLSKFKSKAWHVKDIAALNQTQSSCPWSVVMRFVVNLEVEADWKLMTHTSLKVARWSSSILSIHHRIKTWKPWIMVSWIEFRWGSSTNTPSINSGAEPPASHRHWSWQPRYQVA